MSETSDVRKLILGLLTLTQFKVLIRIMLGARMEMIVKTK
jgi:hypothetical protein